MITKNYINQCSQAKQLQKEWRPKWGDRFTGIAIINSGEDKLEGGIYTISYCEDGWYSVYPKGMDIGLDDYLVGKPNGAFWLPTQEQLCEMVFPSSDRDFVMKLAEIYNWLHKENRKDKRAYRWLKSWNELWLAFVMKERYQKKWLPKEQKWAKSNEK